MEGLKIKVPESFSEIMVGTDWQNIVGQTIENAQPFLDNSPKFFPEYTIHGIDHINHVMKNVERLIPETIINNSLLKAEDIGILACSILIHDLAMFIDDSKFSDLIYNENLKIDGIKPDVTNLKLWEDYCLKSRKFSTGKWKDLAGISYKEIPCLEDVGEWSTRDRLVIGEFLRWYHHRFAFEIAVSDFMGVEILPKSIPARSKELIGLVAYSHGVGIRDMEIEEYCDVHFGSKDYVDNCPVYYLMALLRLADYLDAGIERAPKTLSDIHIFLSEISRKEWLLNQELRYKTFGWRKAKETRTLDMPATPGSTTEFVRVERMLMGIQKELDLSVAVLDEVYRGQYLLSISRITSNILHSKSRAVFAGKFFLNDTRLSASPKILPLLVGPLYNDNPSYGVRELIQNAVDACKELQSKEQEYKGKITIEIDTSQKTFMIRDNGIGMNEDTVVNYYLKAGSSYIDSDEWKKEFVKDCGEAKIVRIGKFGIGALATFLIGDKATVSTRHKDSKFGCKFHYTLDVGNSLDVTCGEKIAIGTCIEIEMSDRACQYFKDKNCRKQWSEWYCYEEPSIDIFLDGEKICNERILPVHFEDSDGWYRFNSMNYMNFIWNYNSHYFRPADSRIYCPELICNGIPVGEIERPYHEYKDQWKNSHWSIIREYGFDLHLPLISLDDYKGKIKLDLSRRILEEFPLEPMFIEELYKYLIAGLLCGKYFSNKSTMWESCHGYIPLAHSDKGYTILARSFVLHTGISIWCFFGHQGIIDINLPIGYMVKWNSLHCSDGLDDFKNAFVNGDLLIHNDQYLECCGGVVCIGEEIPYHINHIELSEYYGESFKGINILNPNKRNLTQDDVETMLQLAGFLKDGDTKFVEYIPTPLKEGENNLMLKVLQKYIPADRNGGWIPYDIEERKCMYPEAFSELSSYMSSQKAF